MRKKRDILFLCQFFYPEYISSAILPYDTVQALNKGGFAVDVMCGYPFEYAQSTDVPVKENIDGVEIHRVKYIQMDRKGFLGRLVNYFSLTFMMFLRLWKLANYRAVVVYSNPPILPWIASWAKVLFGTKLIFVSYDLYPEVATVTGTLRNGNFICRLMDHINQCVFRRADGIVALSHEMKDYIVANRPVAEEKVFVIPNWFEDRYEPEIREENIFRETVRDRFTVSYFGNMGTAQDMQTILGAIRMLKEDPNVFFLFAGHGNKMEKLKNIVADEGISNIEIHDFLHDAVGDDEEDAVPLHAVEGVPNFRVRLRVHGAHGVVEDQDGRLLHEGPGNSHPLELAAGEGHAPLAHQGVVALLKAHDHVVDGSDAGRLLHFFIGGGGVHDADVLPDGAGVEEGLLEHDPDVPAKAGVVDVVDVHAADGDLPPGAGVEPL